MLRYQAGFLKEQIPYLKFKHHQNTKTLRKSREQGCSVCSVLAKQLEERPLNLSEDRPISLRATISALNGQWWPYGYALRIGLEGDDYWLHTFALVSTCKGPFNHSSIWRHTYIPKIEDQQGIRRRTSISDSTSGEDAFELAQHWISKCKCASAAQDWYPDRLLDLQEVKGEIASEKQDIQRARVKLVETSETWKKERSQEGGSTRYVTLSHCWGKHPMPFKLVIRNLETFLTEGITVEGLPKTFREAVIFASRLEGVRYIWIDSLCIIQKSEEDTAKAFVEDWLSQSALMDKIYHQSYLNLSATIASDSSMGIFFPRDPKTLCEDEVILNVTDLARPENEVDEQRGWTRIKSHLGCLIFRYRRAKLHSLWKKCKVVDASFWDDLIERAPVNTRGWVYQERLLAPRVLHFCGNQIAWECSEFDCSEIYPEGIPGVRLNTNGQLVEGDRLKGLTPEREGGMLREARLNSTKRIGFEDPDQGLTRLYTYELWKHIVEVYSRKDLSHPGDKLIALSGIARHFFQEKLTPVLDDPQPHHQYVVGMWEEYLESQLLWLVEWAWEDGKGYHNETTRHADRAPSFSWAAVDAPQGIIYGDFTNQDLFFQVKDIHIEYEDIRYKFGRVDAAGSRLLLNAHLKEIEFRSYDQTSMDVPNGWRVIGPDAEKDPPPWSESNLSMYPDSPEGDADAFNADTKIFCMLGGRGLRTDSENDRYTYCLLLQLKDQHDGHRVFKRIGVAKARNFAGDELKEAFKGSMAEEMYLA